MEHPAVPPSILRRLASMLYEALLLLALLFIAAFIFTAATHNVQSPLLRLFFQVYLLLLGGLYFVGFWLRGGQTLAMKTWHLRVERRDGGRLTPSQAVLRYLLAVVGVALGFGVIWALFDRDKQFWHDRMAGTRIVFTSQ